MSTDLRRVLQDSNRELAGTDSHVAVRVPRCNHREEEGMVLTVTCEYHTYNGYRAATALREPLSHPQGRPRSGGLVDDEVSLFLFGGWHFLIVDRGVRMGRYM